MIDNGTMDCLDLLAKDLCEALAADRMRFELGDRHDTLAKLNGSEADFGLKFITGSLAFRMALAVSRTLQGASGNKATFARLLRLMKAANDNPELSAFERRLDELRNREAARQLRECRNGFMAHTLDGELGSRDGMKSDPIGGLLYELTGLYEDIHRAVKGTESKTIDFWKKWSDRARETADALLGVDNADEDWSFRRMSINMRNS